MPAAHWREAERQCLLWCVTKSVAAAEKMVISFCSRVCSNYRQLAAGHSLISRRLGEEKYIAREKVK